MTSTSLRRHVRSSSACCQRRPATASAATRCPMQGRGSGRRRRRQFLFTKRASHAGNRVIGRTSVPQRARGGFRRREGRSIEGILIRPACFPIRQTPSRPFRPLADRLSARGRCAHGAVQLAVRPPARRGVRPAHRGHRRRALVGRHGHRHPRRPALARPRLGRGARRRRPACAVFPVGAARAVPRRRAQHWWQAGHAYYDFGGPQPAAATARPRTTAPTSGPTTAMPPWPCPPDEVRAAWPPASRMPSAFSCRPARPRFADLVHGPVRFDRAHIEDFVVLRSDGHPTYHLSVVVDDIDMAITHVVRGDDHISNTPKQVLLYEAFGAAGAGVRARAADHGPRQEAAQQAPRRHLGDGVPSGRATCRRRWSTSWRCSAGRRAATTSSSRCDELVARFSLEGISGGNAVFNTEKLDWFNHQHPGPAVRRRADCRGCGRGSSAPACGTTDLERRGAGRGSPRCWRCCVRAASGSASSWSGARPFLVAPTSYDPDGAAKHLTGPGLRAHLEALRGAVCRLAGLRRGRARADAAAGGRVRAGSRPGCSSTPPALAMTGRTVSPGLFEMLRLLGRPDVAARLDRLTASLP